MTPLLNKALTALEECDCPATEGLDGNWNSRCPAHNDMSPSLSTKQENDRVLLNCHAGCTVKDIVKAMGLELADLFDGPNVKKTKARAKPKKTRTRAKKKAPKKTKKKPATRFPKRTEHEYTDENGEPLNAVVKDVGTDGKKTFKQYRYENGLRVPGIKGVRPVPYGLPRLIAVATAGGTVFIPEGEKDADAINALDPETVEFCATTNSGGAGKWKPEFVDHFAGAGSVVIIQDRDKPGRLHARKVLESFKGKHDNASTFEAIEGNDASDHFEAGWSLADFVAVKQEEEEEPERGAVEEPEPDDRLGRLDLAAVATPGIETVDWLVEDMIPVASLILFAAKWKSGKTMLAYTMALEALAGREVFDTFAARPDLRIAFWQFEMPASVNIRRLRKLCLGLGIDPALVGQWQAEGRLQFYAQPDLSLIEEDDLEVFHAEIEKTDPHIVFVDSVGEAGFAVSDNADVRRQLKAAVNTLLRAERSVVLLTHKRKSQQQGLPDAPGDSIIGAQSWAAKASRIYTLDQVAERTPGDFDVRLQSLRGWDLTARTDLCLRIRDVEVGDDWGTRVEPIPDAQALKGGLLGKGDQAKAKIIELITESELKYGELIERLTEAGIIKRTGQRAYSELTSEGKIKSENGVLKWTVSKY